MFFIRDQKWVHSIGTGGLMSPKACILARQQKRLPGHGRLTGHKRLPRPKHLTRHISQLTEQISPLEEILRISQVTYQVQDIWEATAWERPLQKLSQSSLDHLHVDFAYYVVSCVL